MNGYLRDISRDDLAEVVKQSVTLTQILKHFGYSVKGTANFARLRRRLDELSINYSHISTGFGHNKGKRGKSRRAQPLSEILVKGSTYTRAHLKRRLIKEGLLELKCAICGMGQTWNNKPLTLVLDHINGDSTDNRLSNLRLLCPNCNSQQPTFSRSKIKAKPSICTCGSPRYKYSKNGLCHQCFAKSRRKKDRPPLPILLAKVDSQGYEATGREYGVSGNAIRKWIKHYRVV